MRPMKGLDTWLNRHPLQEEFLYTLSVSGGRTSGFLLHLFLEHFHGTLPENVVVSFMNTGKEREETLVFLDQMQQKWDVDIVWLEYVYDNYATGGRRSPHNTFRIVDFESASRNGEPFEQLVIKGRHGYLPNVTQRTCTQDLKVNTLARYIRHEYGLFKTQYKTVLGIRHDERKRALRIFKRDCNVLIPLYEARITAEDVADFWSSNDFDLALPNNVMYSNCDMCFMKGKRSLETLMRKEPERADWWINMEKSITKKRDTTPAQWIKSISYSQIFDLSKQPLLFEEEAEPQGFSCFCGD